MFTYTAEQIQQELLGARDAIAACGIPADQVVGARMPYLEATPAMRQVLSDAGFAYDSTVIEPQSGSLSQGASGRVWPYSLANGFPAGINCQW